MNRKQEPLPGPGHISFQNIWQNAIVSGRVTIVKGSVEGGGNGSVITWYMNDVFPSQRFPLVNGEFKALVRLETGENKIMFEAERPNAGPARQELTLNFQAIKENPPVHYCLLVAKDSPLCFDSQDHKRNAEGNGIEQAIAKLRMCAYLQSAFTQEQMSRNRFGFRTYQPHEEFEKCTLSARDTEDHRPTAHIHVIRLDKTTAEIRDPDVAQQYKHAKRSGDLFSWAGDALQQYPPFNSGKFEQAACIYLDTHYDPRTDLVQGHAALGGSTGNLRLAIFGGHALHSWPKNFEDLVACFNDTTPTDKRQVANDAPDNSFTYELLNVSMGAFMHEIGHHLGCPHEPSGVMLRGYENWNRSFMISEPPNPRSNGNRPKLITLADEDYWHRLDILRFRWHPAFRLPGEPRYKKWSKPVFYPIKDGVEVQSENGVFMVDIWNGDSNLGSFEYLDCPKRVTIMLRDVMAKLSPEDQKTNFKIEAHVPGIEFAGCEDFAMFVQKNSSLQAVAIPVVGRESGEYQETKLPPGPFREIVVWAGSGLDGIEFIDNSGHSIWFGKRGGSPHKIDIGPGNEFLGISVRAGWWVDAGGVITRQFSTPQYGGSGGDLTNLVPPQGKRITAISGWFENWCQGLRIHYDL